MSAAIYKKSNIQTDEQKECVSSLENTHYVNIRVGVTGDTRDSLPLPMPVPVHVPALRRHSAA